MEEVSEGFFILNALLIRGHVSIDTLDAPIASKCSLVTAAKKSYTAH